MRTLEPEILLTAIVLISVLLGLCFINMIIFVRYSRSFLTYGFHLSSIFGLAGLYCWAMDVVILDLPFQGGYRIAVKFFLAIFAISVILFTTLRYTGGFKTAPLFGLSSDSKILFTESLELSLVADDKGLILDVNHPEHMEKILSDPDTSLKDIYAQLRRCADDPDSLPDSIDQIKTGILFEVKLWENTVWYLIHIVPITTGELQLGFAVLFQNITAVRQGETELAIQNAALMDANRRLTRYVTIASALEEEKKRIQIFEHLQSTVISRIQDAIAQITRIQSRMDKLKVHHSRTMDFQGEVNASQEEVNALQGQIKETAALLRGVYSDVRISVSQIAGKEIT